LKLTANILAFVKEAYTPQWYSPEEDSDMDKRVRDLFKSFHAVMDLLKGPAAVASGHEKDIAHGFDAPKIHAASSTAVDARRLGCNGNSDTEGGERNQKDLKESDMFTDPNVDESNGPLLQALAARARNAASSELLKGNKKFVPLPSSGKKFYQHSSSINTLGEGHKWDALVESLSSSHAGPIVATHIIAKCTSVPVLAQIHGFQHRHPHHHGHDDASASDDLPVDCHAGHVYFHSEVSVPCNDKKVSSYNFTAGHTILTTQGTYIQLLVPVVTHKTVYESGGGKGADAQCIVSEFVPVRLAKLMHPELDIPWIRRGNVTVISVRDLVRRVHIPPDFGHVHRRQGETRDHFLVNTLGDPYYAGPRDRLVFQRCRQGDCAGMLPIPSVIGSLVACNLCGHSCQWF
jgi:hypothetical protein